MAAPPGHARARAPPAPRAAAAVGRRGEDWDDDEDDDVSEEEEDVAYRMEVDAGLVAPPEEPEDRWDTHCKVCRRYAPPPRRPALGSCAG
jgi:hypothetical protein